MLKKSLIAGALIIGALLAISQRNKWRCIVMG